MMGDTLTIERHGASYRINDPGGRIAQPLRQGRPYEAKMLDEIWGRKFTGVALDIGANVGNHSLFFAAVCGLTVYAFEPEPGFYAQLVDNLILNPYLNITPYDVAAGAEKGKGRMLPSMHVKPDPDGDVLVLPIDELIPHVEDVSVIKVDVEGGEPQALAGAARLIERWHPVIYTETHTRAAGQRTAAVLDPLGYQPTGAIHMGSTMERWEWA